MPVPAPTLIGRLTAKAESAANQLGLDKAYKFLSGDSPLSVPFYAAAASAPAIGYMLERHNEERAERERLVKEHLARMYGVTPPGEEAIERAQAAVKTALHKSAEPEEGLNLVREALRSAKERARACP